MSNELCNFMAFKRAPWVIKVLLKSCIDLSRTDLYVVQVPADGRTKFAARFTLFLYPVQSVPFEPKISRKKSTTVSLKGMPIELVVYKASKLEAHLACREVPVAQSH